MATSLLGACRPIGGSGASSSCQGAPARAVSRTGTLNVVWGAETYFFLRDAERSIPIVIDRPNQVSADILQGLSARRVRVDGRESRASDRICADSVVVIDGATP